MCFGSVGEGFRTDEDIFCVEPKPEAPTLPRCFRSLYIGQKRGSNKTGTSMLRSNN